MGDFDRGLREMYGIEELIKPENSEYSLLLKYEKNEFIIKEYFIQPAQFQGKNKIIYLFNNDVVYMTKNKNDFTDELKKEMKEFLFQKQLEELKAKKTKFQKDVDYFNEYFKDEIRVKKIKNIINEK